MARMKVFTSLMGTTRPIRQSTGGTCAGRLSRMGAKRASWMPLGMLNVRAGSGAVLHLAQAVGFIQRDDRVGRRIAVAPHPFKQPDPHLPEVRQLGRVALEDVAVVANPLALEQIDLPFLGVDAVLRQGKRYVAGVVQNGPKTCIACGRAVQHPHRDQVCATLASVHRGLNMMRTVQK